MSIHCKKELFQNNSKVSTQKEPFKSSFVISVSLLFRLSAQYDLDSASLNSCIMKQKQTELINVQCRIVCNIGIKEYPVVRASFRPAPCNMLMTMCQVPHARPRKMSPSVYNCSDQMFIQHCTYCNRTYLNYLGSNEH